MRLSRLLMLVLLLAALPSRGYAGELMAPCGAHHGGSAAAQEHVREHGDRYHDDSGDGGTPAHTASVCSICASCCAGASLAPDANTLVTFPAPGFDRISFFDRPVSGFDPEQFDRPPLTS